MASDLRPLSRPPRWWQWPTVLSLDAPAVGLLWQWLLAGTAGVALPASRAFLLGASIWLAYSADRWTEGWRLAPERIRTHRHSFYQRRRWPVAFIWGGVFVAAVAVAARSLRRAEWMDGLVLLALVLVYLLSHQLIHRHHRWRVPKEVCIACLLGSGVALFIFPRAGWAGLAAAAAPFALFVLLCFANCALISVWESLVDQSHGQTSWARQFPWGATLSRIFPWLLVAAAWVAAGVAPPGGRMALACAGVSSLLLIAVDAAERRLGWQRARVLADVALLTPLVPWLGHFLR